jgi:PilZ domain
MLGARIAETMDAADIQGRIEQALGLLEAAASALRDAPSTESFPRDQVGRLIMRARARVATLGDPSDHDFVAGVLMCNGLLDDALNLAAHHDTASEAQVQAISAIERGQAILYFIAFRGPDGTPEGRPVSIRPRTSRSSRPPAPAPVWSVPPPAESVPQAPSIPASAPDASAGLALAVQVTWEGPTNFYLGFEDDIARGGLFVATYHRPSLGAEVALSITLPSGHVARARGAVRWTRDVLDPDEDSTPGIGIALDSLSPADHDAITAFTRVRAPMFYDDES